MEKLMEILKQPRLFLLGLVNELSIEQMNIIPEGFNNNIIWNIGHLIAAQQGVCYIRGGLEPRVSPEFMATYKSGSRPERQYNQADVDEIKNLFIPTLDLLATDLKTDMFKNYGEWTTRYGVNISSVEDAVSFLPFHEGLHLGTIVAMKKLVG